MLQVRGRGGRGLRSDTAGGGKLGCEMVGFPGERIHHHISTLLPKKLVFVVVGFFSPSTPAANCLRETISLSSLS